MSRYANARKLGHGQLARDESLSLRDGTRDGNAVTVMKERELWSMVKNINNNLEFFGQ